METGQMKKSREERRALHAVDKRFSKRAAAHKDCVLERDTAGVLVRIQSAEDLHRFHVARGEERCPRCPLCAAFKARGAWPRKMSSAERAQTIEQWQTLIETTRADAIRDAEFERARRQVDGTGA